MKSPTKTKHREWLATIKEQGVADVKSLDEEPEVLPHALIYWNAYNTVTRARQWREGRPMAIPLTEVHAYARLFKWEEGHIDTFLRVMDALETVYFQWQAKNAKRTKGKGKRPPRPPRKK